MNKVVTIPTHNEHQIANALSFSHEQVEILKNSICKGVSNEEFQIFLMACKKTQLDPFMRQIYAVKRWDSKQNKNTMTIQTGIDGYRLIAERTGCYAPDSEPTFNYDSEGKLMSATAYIKKQTKDGTWHTISASAYMDEYCQKTKDGRPMGMWSNMPRTMLAKCAEALALRKAFPAEMSGVYTKEEMIQAEDISPKISLEQASELNTILSECSLDYVNWFYSSISKKYKTEDLCELPADLFERMKAAALKNMHETFSKNRQLEVQESEDMAEEIQ